MFARDRELAGLALDTTCDDECRGKPTRIIRGLGKREQLGDALVRQRNPARAAKCTELGKLVAKRCFEIGGRMRRTRLWRWESSSGLHGVIDNPRVGLLP